jgi:protein-disulfide isomerase
MIRAFFSSPCDWSFRGDPGGKRLRLAAFYNRQMLRLCLRALMLAGLFVAGAALVGAQDWNAAEALPGVDLNGLTAAQKQTVLKLLRDRDCSCGCGMKVAECRIKDPNCFYSRGLASVIVDAIKAGKSEKEALAAAASSQFAHGPDQRILGDPVPVPTAGAPVIGPRDAPVALVEFSDFQCPYCALATPQLRAVLKAYPTQVKLYFKQFPLDTHSQAAFAAAAAVSAQRQGKFWEMHDALFASRKDLSRPTILALASAIGLDVKRFEADLDSPDVRKAVARDVQDGDRIGVMSTPTLFIDGRHFNGPIKLEVLKPLLDEELKHAAAAPHTASR